MRKRSITIFFSKKQEYKRSTKVDDEKEAQKLYLKKKRRGG